MQYAVDRYVVGKEKEVTAVEFEDKNIPERRNRFFCPECGERVFYRNRGGNHPSQFYHQEKTAQAPECDKRVDGRSGLTLSQRVGLPVFLTCSVSGQFQLNIGFPALGAEMLGRASKLGYKVKISGGNCFRTVGLNPTNFIEDEMTLIPVDFIPPSSENLEIFAYGEGNIVGLQRKWSDYADGFGRGGAVFSYNEMGGKKIRCGDSISTNRDYYAVVRSKLHSYSAIKQELVGNLMVGNISYKVYRFNVNVSTEDANYFSMINSYLKETFGIWLLECLPEIIPIWPPVIQRDVMVPIKTKSALCCVVSSGNSDPKVYTYSNIGAKNKEIEILPAGIKIINVLVGRDPVALSVDRKYVGREVTFVAREVPSSIYQHEIRITNNKGLSFPWKEIYPALVSEDFFIETNAKFDFYIREKKRIYRHIPIRNSVTMIPSCNVYKELLCITENAIFEHCLLEKEICSYKYDDYYDKLLKSANKGLLIPIPRWINPLMKTLKRKRKTRIYEVILQSMKSGKIHLGILKQLQLIDLEIKKAMYEKNE